MLLAGPWQDSNSMALWMSCSFCMGSPGFYTQVRRLEPTHIERESKIPNGPLTTYALVEI
jgi:hypothetical protein